ncbi:barstar family protein [Planobispora takensis]|uniref:barstar family protein n=1 Tax=Planobispora takensis TaxID=1367882 RepID=UPI001EF1EDD5
MEGFSCALGEAVNGPGGYFGWNLDAPADCLRGGWAAAAPFHLIWHHAQVARRHLVPGDYCVRSARHPRRRRIHRRAALTHLPALCVEHRADRRRAPGRAMPPCSPPRRNGPARGRGGPLVRTKGSVPNEPSWTYP